MLDRLESRLGERSFLLGEQITEADWAKSNSRLPKLS
jgi:glutathionyl-hydroquinone reductase